MNNSATIFYEGAIPASMLSDCLQEFAGELTTGAYSCFIGQVRADLLNGQKVIAIEYTAYTSMADEQMNIITEEVKQQYGLNASFVRHSIGVVEAGGICLFVLAMAGHRKAAMDACNTLVERIKKELPVWGKELVEGEGYQWKINK